MRSPRSNWRASTAGSARAAVCSGPIAIVCSQRCRADAPRIARGSRAFPTLPRVSAPMRSANRSTRSTAFLRSMRKKVASSSRPVRASAMSSVSRSRAAGTCGRARTPGRDDRRLHRGRCTRQESGARRHVPRDRRTPRGVHRRRRHRDRECRTERRSFRRHVRRLRADRHHLARDAAPGASARGAGDATHASREPCGCRARAARGGERAGAVRVARRQARTFRPRCDQGRSRQRCRRRACAAHAVGCARSAAMHRPVAGDAVEPRRHRRREYLASRTLVPCRPVAAAARRGAVSAERCASGILPVSAAPAWSRRNGWFRTRASTISPACSPNASHAIAR